MKVCLINPAWRFLSRADIVFSNNLGLAYLASYLRKYSKHTPYIIDALAEGYRYSETVDDHLIRIGLPFPEIIKRIAPDTGLIGITVPFSHLAEEAELTCKAIKSVFANIPVIMGGIHPSSCPDDFKTSLADYWLIGEGEYCLMALADGHPPETLNGILTRKRPSPNLAGKAWQVEHLDDIPLPARDLLPMQHYLKLSQRRTSHKQTACIITSRGCPWKCRFCAVHPVSGYRWRGRSSENVLIEIQHLIETYGIRHLEFEDDNLTLNRKRAKEIFNGMTALRYQHHIDLTWEIPNGIRCETVDREMLKLMLRSGCTRITYALEHGDPAIRESMCKKMDIEKFERAVWNAIDIGLPVDIMVMIGYPGETEERFKTAFEYYRQLRDWGVANFIFLYAQPYPGTELNRYCREHHYLTGNDRDLWPAVKIETPDFHTADIIRRHKTLLLEFDRKYRLRHKVRSILPGKIAEIISRYRPEKAI